MGKEVLGLIEKQNFKKILIINLAGIGDFIMSSPAIRALRSYFPNAEIFLLVYSFNKELAEGSPYVNNIFTFDKICNLRNIDTLFKLSKEKFDIAINLYNLYSFKGIINMVLMLKIIGAKKSLGRNTDGKGFFYDYKFPERLLDPMHQVQQMLNTVALIGAKDQRRDLEIWVPEGRSKNLDKFLKVNNISKDDFIIGLNPGSGRPSRRWPIEYFAKVADQLKNRYNAKIVITGSKNEIGLARRLNKLSQKQHIISSGEFSLPDLVNFIRMCRLYISNDTGPMHIANALGVPLIAIIGGGPQSCYPYVKEKTIILKKDKDCSPCFKFDCKRKVCLKDISPEEAMEAAETLLK